MVGRLTDAADFERLLATPMRSRSAHFAVHHVTSGPLARRSSAVHRLSRELSTGDDPIGHPPVDESADGHWLGCMLPKRHARRAVTRNLLRRQIRAALERHARRLAAGCWLVRLRSPFAVAQFPSAASEALRTVVRDELDQLLTRAAAAPRGAR